MLTTTDDHTGFGPGLEALDQFAAPIGELRVLDLREQSEEESTALFCSYCYLDTVADQAA